MLPLLLLVLGVAGCASGSGYVPHPQAAVASAERDPGNAEVLSLLWSERSLPASRAAFKIGPGDVLQISVPGFVELESYETRVSGEGNISLPLIGAVPAAGMDEEGLARKLERRLTSMMYDPSVVVRVTDYYHREVGVIGAVENPGFYSLMSDRATILDAISLAGGMAENAASRVLLHPASEGAPPGPARLDVAASPQKLDRGDFLVIDFDPKADGGSSRYVNFPLRPGDVVVIPDRGHVLVKGWVHKPGSYEISTDLTVLGSVIAAGGLRYAANKSAVKLVRGDASGEPLSIRFDVRKLQSGEQTDVPVLSGDVIDVSHSTPKVIASSIVEFVSKVLSVGAGAF